MLPDYPHKLFSDKRDVFSLLMEAMAMGSARDANSNFFRR
jgi:hypothetical protein